MKRQYVVRYRLNERDVTRLVIVDAISTNDCIHKALNWIYRIHDLNDVYDRSKVVLDLDNSVSL